jgi:hypothetical protein
MIYRLGLLSAIAVLLGSPAAAQTTSHFGPACIGTDADAADLQVREVACLFELRDRASRKGDILTLKLDNGTTKIYHSNPCTNDSADNCASYRLVGYHVPTKRYLVCGAYYEEHDCKLVSARDGKTTTIANIPHFAPDGSTFIVMGDEYSGALVAIRTMSSNPPAPVWQLEGDDRFGWQFVRWIDNDRVALRLYSDAGSCPSGSCDAVLKRAASGWVLERSLSQPGQK